MAVLSRNPEEKAALLQLAQEWLRMIPKAGPIKSSEWFDAAERARTRQTM